LGFKKKYKTNMLKFTDNNLNDADNNITANARKNLSVKE